MTLDEDGYPTEDTLIKIEKFVFGPHFMNLPDFVELIRENWWCCDWGFKLDMETGFLELHTGGWSGNEDLIDAMKRNKWFFVYFWEKSVRGGHYWFELFQFDENGMQCHYLKGAYPK